MSLAGLSELPVIQNFFAFEFARIALVCTVVVGLLCGLLSPVIVLKQRAFIGDTLAHLVFPGVIAGYVLSQTWGFPLWGSLLVGAIVTGLLGNVVTDALQKTLGIPPDAAAVTALTGFFGTGVLALSQVSETRLNLDGILFGDVLTLSWTDAGVLVSVLVAVCALLASLRVHWDVWLSDPEFGRLAGFRVTFVERLFPVLVTGAVLTGMLSVGALMISALLALPAVLTRPTSAFSLTSLLVGGFLSFSGLLAAFAFDWPVGSAIVVLGLVLVLVKVLVVRAKK